MLQLTDLHKSYRVGRHELEVLRGVELSIEAGELVSITGSSGSGKSTLLNVLGLLDGYERGSYHLDGKLVKGLSERRAARHRNRLLGFVFQSFNLIAFKTALENVALPLYYQGLGRRERGRRAAALLERFGLLEWSSHLPSELSGGQQQRVAIARALVGRPKVLLADEPTGALDAKTSLEVMDILEGINADGVTVIVVTHEADIAARTRRTIHLEDGLVRGLLREGVDA